MSEFKVGDRVEVVRAFSDKWNGLKGKIVEIDTELETKIKLDNKSLQMLEDSRLTWALHYGDGHRDIIHFETHKLDLIKPREIKDGDYVKVIGPHKDSVYKNEKAKLIGKKFKVDWVSSNSAYWPIHLDNDGSGASWKASELELVDKDHQEPSKSFDKEQFQFSLINELSQLLIEVTNL